MSPGVRHRLGLVTDDARELFDFDTRAVEVEPATTAAGGAALGIVGVCVAFGFLVGACAAIAFVIWYLLYGVASVGVVGAWLFTLQ